MTRPGRRSRLLLSALALAAIGVHSGHVPSTGRPAPAGTAEPALSASGRVAAADTAAVFPTRSALDRPSASERDPRRVPLLHLAAGGAVVAWAVGRPVGRERHAVAGCLFLRARCASRRAPPAAALA